MIVPLVAAVLTSCGNAVEDIEPAGLTAVGVDEDGHLLVTAYVCRGKVDSVVVTADREGLDETATNEQLARFERKKPTAGLVQLDLADPGADWQPHKPFKPDATQGFVVTTEGSDDAETTGVWITATVRASLRPGRFYVNTGDPDSEALEPISRSTLIRRSHRACA